MLARLIGAAVLLALLPGNARAQLPVLFRDEPAKPRENALQQAESERVHRTALKNIPDKKPSNDPWRNMRSASQPPAADRHRVE